LAFNIIAVSNEVDSNPLLPNVKEIIEDLNTLIKNKLHTLSNNDLISFLDDTYGFQISGIFLSFIKYV